MTERRKQILKRILNQEFSRIRLSKLAGKASQNAQEAARVNKLSYVIIRDGFLCRIDNGHIIKIRPINKIKTNKMGLVKGSKIKL